MMQVVAWLCLIGVVRTMPHGRPNTGDSSNKIEHLEEQLERVSRQLMMQQYYVEEAARSGGNSGIKRMRSSVQGMRTYHSASYADTETTAAIHDHPNYERTLGLGEIVAVLNGVEFRTRHNDYPLKMRQENNGPLVDIPFPDVPREVTQYTSVDDQIKEMREWFKAWAKQDRSKRDYRPFFNPVLCILEGAWTHSDPSTIDEPFDSERNHLDANSWLELAKKVRFTSHSGSKDGDENLAYLPTAVMYLNGTDPVVVQWNYKIVCHPLKDDLKLNRLHAVDDIHIRMAMGGVTMEEYEKTRSARFQLATFDKNKWTEGSAAYSFLDKLMEQVPGGDGYGGNIRDTLFNDDVFQFRSGRASVPLNVAYYHRWYKVRREGASGRQRRHRGFADQNMFLAQNTDTKMAGLTVEKCRGYRCTGQTWTQQWTYAIPLEIVYMTPLSKWNPYDIMHMGDGNSTEGQRIYDNQRTGSSAATAYDGVNSHDFYITPDEFFDDQIAETSSDTVRNTVHVLDRSGTPRKVRNSGFWVQLPNIPGVGKLRQRYPIIPVHEEGTGVWKEMEALKDIVLQPDKYSHMYYKDAE